MFNHKSKVTKIVPPEYIKDYKHLLFFLRDLLNQEKLPMHPKNNYLGENKLAHDIYKSKYYLKNLKDELIEKRPEETFARRKSNCRRRRFIQTENIGKLFCFYD